ncbi:hypothetical protein SAMN05428642_1011094 [Flaviramulus basaltis]|uniref:Protein NO VEIN C-terminal domain-containing protein n=1 Tax=Flaviramulus basaltis TaxID=369401 RepID=A0A1K2IEN9_9FLAO|nr:hypothetical protein [Flaviramulus basaltis]SFZ90710.1 hypothetical protein SAMN05428642_1011094 [Flaviramulus basaltis]
MSRAHTFKLTLSNNVTEKEGISYMLEEQTGFFKIDLPMKKDLLDILELPHSFKQSFDMIYIPKLEGFEFKEDYIETYLDEIQFIEIKTTKKFLPENPKGFFFGATENEFNFAKLVGDRFRFCFISLNPKSLSYSLLKMDELEEIIKNKRIQYQINL